jgi:hypothetical protein
MDFETLTPKQQRHAAVEPAAETPEKLHDFRQATARGHSS